VIGSFVMGAGANCWHGASVLYAGDL
jgi:hypothetical protein